MINTDDYTQPLETVMGAEIREAVKETPQDVVEQFSAWAQHNHEGMCAMRDKGREMISRHKHPSARYLLEWLRRDSNVKLDDCGGQYKIANIFSPILARIFVRDFPEFKEHFNLAKSEFDEVELPTIDWS